MKRKPTSLNTQELILGADAVAVVLLVCATASALDVALLYSGLLLCADRRNLAVGVRFLKIRALQ